MKKIFLSGFTTIAIILLGSALMLAGCKNPAKTTVKTFLVTVNSTGSGAAGGGMHKKGDTVAINAGTAPVGYQFKNWTSADGVEFADAASAETSFTMLAKPVTVTANFELKIEPGDKYLVTVESDGTGASGGGEYKEGDTVTIYAGEAHGQQFVEWTSADGITFANAAAATTSFTMLAKTVTVTANFEPLDNAFKVTVESEGAGASGTGYYEENDIVTIKAGTVSGQQFVEWTSDVTVTFDDCYSGETFFVMPASEVTVTASFEPLDNAFKVTVISEGAGASGTGYYIENDIVTIKAGTVSGKQFMEWTSDVTVTFDDPYSGETFFTMPASEVTVTASFEPLPSVTYKVTVESNGAGASGTGDYEENDTVTIKAGTVTGLQFVEWTSDVTVTFDDPYSEETFFIMPASEVTVTASFEPIPPDTYKVTVESEGTGASGTGYYEENDTVTIKAGTAPAEKYFVNWTSADGITFDDDSSEETFFTMPDKEVTVTANFAVKTYPLTVNSVGTGASGSGSYAMDAVVPINAGTPPAKYRFVNWTSSDGVAFANANNAATTITMLNKAVAVTANFEVITYAINVNTPSNGSFTVTIGGQPATFAPEDAVVILTAAPEQDYDLFSFTVSYGSGLTAITEEVGENVWQFTMPASNVDVSAIFAPKPDEGEGSANIIVNVDANFAGFPDLISPLSKSNGDEQGITLVGTFVSTAWYIDGILASSASTYTIKAEELSVGPHSLTVVVKAESGGLDYSKELNFAVTR